MTGDNVRLGDNRMLSFRPNPLVFTQLINQFLDLFLGQDLRNFGRVFKGCKEARVCQSEGRLARSDI